LLDACHLQILSGATVGANKYSLVETTQYGVRAHANILAQAMSGSEIAGP
jgi:hypothetical protein